MAEPVINVRNKFVKKPKSRQLQIDRSSRYNSIVAIEELLECGICLEKLNDARMLPCQHTFCLVCLKSHLQALTDKTCINCPICQYQLQLDDGLKSIENLPRNLYIDSLLKVVEDGTPPPPPPLASPKSADGRCIKCQTISQEQQCCRHCIQNYCKICYNQHLTELESNLEILQKQLDESKNRLDYKLENFEDRCHQLDITIREAVEKKIDELKLVEQRILDQVQSMKTEKRIVYDSINDTISKIQTKLATKPLGSDNTKVLTFMTLHNETSQLLKQVSRFGEASIIFDPDNFRLEQATEGIYNDLDEPETNKKISAITLNPLENADTMAQYYQQQRSFVPKLIWNKCPRPGHVGIPPWDRNLLYICATDTHTVLIIKRDKIKLQQRLIAPQMLYPVGIAFSKTYEEIYVTDKWQHCVHVFSINGKYLRQLCTKGSGPGRIRSPDGIAITSNNQLVISDCGNNRIIVIDPNNNGKFITTIDKNRTRLNMPMDVAVFNDNIIVADTGNHRIKLFNLNGDYLFEFGSFGRGRGQFLSADVVTVDPLGMILVGDSGNARIQVFKPDGSLLKIFGNHSFGWISGICISPELDIIITDKKTRTLTIF